ncbi:hypothetical protein AAMO2058_001518000 [Amorphochlora amoebiformis]
MLPALLAILPQISFAYTHPTPPLHSLPSGLKTKTALLIIDMTVEQWAGISYLRNETLGVIEGLVETKGFDLILDSHLWMECGDGDGDEGGPGDEGGGGGETGGRTASNESTLCEVTAVGRKNTEPARLIPSLRRPWVEFVEKKQYSCFYASPLDALLRTNGVSVIYVVGINSNYCVFATVLEAWERGYDTRVVMDGITSVDGQEGHERGLKMLHSFFDLSTSFKFINSTDIDIFLP